VAEENIDSTLTGTGLFNTKIPGFSDAADIQAALRLYHYGSSTYDVQNTNPNNLIASSIAGYLHKLKTGNISFSYPTVNDFPAAASNGGYIAHAISTGKLYFAHNGEWIPLVDEDFLQTAITDAINGAEGGYPSLAGNGIEWNSVETRFDLEPQLLNNNTLITKTSGFTLDPVDVNKTILLSTSSPMNLTIPLNSSVSIPVGYKYTVIEVGTGVTTFVPASGVTLNSKNSQLFIDTRYGHAVLIKVDTDSWIAYGDIYEGVATPTPVPTPTPTPIAPTPIPTPIAPTPTPTPTVQPIAPVPTPTPTPTVQPIAPIAPVAPVAPVPTPAPTPVPVVVLCNGAIENYTVTIPTCNGEDSYEGIWQGTRKLCTDGSYEIVTVAGPGTGTFIGYGNCIATNVSSCGGSGGSGTSPCPTIPTPTPTPTPVVSGETTYWYTGCCNGTQITGTGNDFTIAFNSMNAQCGTTITNQQSGVYTTTPNIPTISCPTTPTPTPTPTPTACNPDWSLIPQSQCEACGLVWDPQLGECVSNSPTPTPTACNPDWSLIPQSQCEECGLVWAPEFGECISNSPTPTPAPVAPTPIPTPTPTPTAQPVAPVPTPVPVNICADTSLLTSGQCSQCGLVWDPQLGECVEPASPTPTPAPVAPTPIPTPTPAPVAPVPAPTPAPVAPVPAPTPAPVAPVPAPTPAPVAPVPTPTPIACDCIRNYCFEPCPSCCNGDCGC
jgi:rubredoxin